MKYADSIMQPIVYKHGYGRYQYGRVPRTFCDHAYNPNHLLVIPVGVGFQPTGANEMQGVPYIYICSRDLLWTAWKGLGIVVERARGW